MDSPSLDRVIRIKTNNCRGGIIENVYPDNVKCRKSRYGVFITGFEDLKNILNINVQNCDWNNVQDNNRIEGLVDGLSFSNNRLNGEIQY